MAEARFVILGGGMVAGYAAKQMVELGLKPGELAILSADTAIPYERPPLSKGFLAGKDSEDSIRINSNNFYHEHGIDVKLGCEIRSIDAKQKRLNLKSGGPVKFNKLVVATGARPRTLNIPGASSENLFYLRSMNDSKAIRAAAQSAKRVVVIGSGFIGMEVAAVLAQKTIEVTMVLAEDRIWKRLFTPEMSRFFEGYYGTRGVRFVKNSQVTELRGTGAVNTVVLADGKTISCEMVVAGIGVQPATEMLADSGLDIGDGLMVNEYLEASHPDTLGAGDVANYQDVLFAKRRRVEHWDNAVSQGQHCARVLMGERTPFRHVPYFFSDVFDLSYEYWGDSFGAEQIVHRGDLSSNSFSVWWLRQKQLVAAFIMKRPAEERDFAPDWIESKQVLSGAKLADASIAISAALQ
jgi:NADPH-dependent 2,4-dienoyl-CoA reductase/sulfur reductase-like enzyme